MHSFRFVAAFEKYNVFKAELEIQLFTMQDDFGKIQQKLTSKEAMESMIKMHMHRFQEIKGLQSRVSFNICLQCRTSNFVKNHRNLH
jgi:hypothetical protein